MQLGILSGKYFLVSDFVAGSSWSHEFAMLANRKLFIFFQFFFSKKTAKTVDMSKALLFSKLKTITPVIVGVSYDIFCSFRHEMYIVCL